VGNGLGDTVDIGLSVGDGLGDTVGVAAGLELAAGEESRGVPSGDTVPPASGLDVGSAAELPDVQAEMARHASKARMAQPAAASLARSFVVATAACAFMEPLLVCRQVAARSRYEGP
jgi:hypothetical protein